LGGVSQNSAAAPSVALFTNSTSSWSPWNTVTRERTASGSFSGLRAITATSAVPLARSRSTTTLPMLPVGVVTTIRLLLISTLLFRSSRVARIITPWYQTVAHRKSSFLV
jgi:hypothetical protein